MPCQLTENKLKPKISAKIIIIIIITNAFNNINKIKMYKKMK